MGDPTKIEIAWANRATYDRNKIAMDVQDAVNLRAVAREFVKVVDQAAEKNPSAPQDDPAVILFANKIESMTKSSRRFSDAYNAIEKGAA